MKPDKEPEKNYQPSGDPLSLTNEFFSEGIQQIRALFTSLRSLGPYDPETLPKTLLHMAKHQPQHVAAVIRFFQHGASDTVDSSPLANVTNIIEALALSETQRLNRSGLFHDMIDSPRPPTTDELRTIAIEDIAVFPKKTTLDYDLMQMQAAEPDRHYQDVISEYARRGYSERSIARILRSHDAHHQTLTQLSEHIPRQQFYDIDSLSKMEIQEIISSSKLVVVPSGDDHAKRISHLIDDQLVLFMNSDPGLHGSVGAHAYFIAHEIGEILQRIRSGNFLIEDWTRIEGRINGKRMPSLALSEVSIAEREHDIGSRLSVEFRGSQYTWKGSGALIATGYGSSGWYQAATRTLHPLLGGVWPRTSQELIFSPRELYASGGAGELLFGVLEDGESVRITSHLKRDGVISVDSVIREPFPNGAVAEFSRSPVPLKVISDLCEH
ncbi:MAG: hypothetical protein ACO3XO_06300 [Bdellovibrionota bacterium]